MSKKKFSTGLDSLFDLHEEKQIAEVATPSVSGAKMTFDNDANIPTATRKTVSKNFTSDLDSLFKDAFTDAVEEKLGKMRRTSGLDDMFEDQERRSSRPSLSGLDALIRSTVDSSLASLEHATVRRLTIMFENQKIEKLKSIAKLERSFVKDLVNGVLTEFINDYEKRTGQAF